MKHISFQTDWIKIGFLTGGASQALLTRRPNICRKKKSFYLPWTSQHLNYVTLSNSQVKMASQMSVAEKTNRTFLYQKYKCVLPRMTFPPLFIMLTKISR